MLSLSACGTPSVSTPSIDRPPSLIEPCLGPVKIPERDLSRSEVVGLWGTDRTRLLDCAEKQKLLTAAMVETVR